MRDGLLFVRMNRNLCKAEYFIQVHFADQLVGNGLTMFPYDLCNYQSRAVAVVAAAKIDLNLQQLACLVESHITSGP